MTGPTEFEQEVRGWFAGRLPEGWFGGPPSVEIDREEILAVGTIADVELGAEATKAERTAARGARIDAFREETRAARMTIADEAEHRFRHKVSWGVRCGDVTRHFTTLALPFMTRLRMRERAVLDTLVDAGVARSRAEALAWCVRLVGEHQAEWISDLRAALTSVESVRREGPKLN